MEKFQIIKPSAVLAPFVKHYWFLETSISGAPQRIIPTGYVSLVFHKSDRLYSVSNNQLHPRSFVSGQTTVFFDLLQTGIVSMISVVFQPFGAKAFFNMPISEFKNQDISSESLSDPSLKDLENRIMDTPDITSCISMIEGFLIEKLSITKDYNYKRINAVVRAVNQGQSDIPALASLSCLSYKQFKRIFTEYIGVNPKDFLRIIRFQKALHILQTNPEISFTQLAFECGYYDQPHLVKEFRLFSGYSPTEFLAVCPPYSDYFTLT